MNEQLSLSFSTRVHLHTNPIGLYDYNGQFIIDRCVRSANNLRVYAREYPISNDEGDSDDSAGELESKIKVCFIKGLVTIEAANQRHTSILPIDVNSHLSSL
jgi:hypothetical protein